MLALVRARIHGPHGPLDVSDSMSVSEARAWADAYYAHAVSVTIRGNISPDGTFSPDYHGRLILSRDYAHWFFNY